MSLWKIAWRSIQQRALASTLTGLSMALGVALVVAVLVIYGVVSKSFARGAQGYDLIVGAKGGKLQLVLNTVYHLSTPVENVPWSFYKKFKQSGPGNFGSEVALAIPYCLGDNYEGYRVIGTTAQMFEIDFAPGQKYAFSAGRNFEEDHYFEAVVGALAARETGLKVGGTFQPTHGITGDQGHKHDPFKVVGILSPTGTPNDRALFVNMEGFYLLAGHAKSGHTANPHHHDEVADKHDAHEDDHDHEHAKDGKDADHDHDHDKQPAGAKTAAAGDGKHADDDHDHDADKHAAAKVPAAGKPADHDHEHADHDHEHAAGDHDHEHEHGDHHHEPLPEDEREVTAILVRTTTPLVNGDLYRRINEGNVAQAVFPATEITNLFQGLVGDLERILLALAALVIVVAGIGVMVSIYNSMSDRRRDIAVMRALGAGRGTVLAIVLLESILLALAGGAFGFVLGHLLIGALSPQLVAKTGVSIGLFEFEQYEFILVPVLVVLAAIAGFLPGLMAYRTDVAKVLSNAP